MAWRHASYFEFVGASQLLLSVTVVTHSSPNLSQMPRITVAFWADSKCQIFPVRGNFENKTSISAENAPGCVRVTGSTTMERLHIGDHRSAPFESRRSEPRDIGRERFVPLYLSDSDGEPQPSEYTSPSSPGRRRASISSRILAAVCAAAAAAVLFALFSSDAMRDLVNARAAMASVASIFPTPSAAAPSNTPSPPAAPSKDPARLSAPANRIPGVPTIAMANVTPTREEMKNAYQSALQSQAPAAAAVAEPVAPVSALHRIDPNEVAAALKRAGALIASGDIAAARLVLQRVADDGDAQAAVTLAETYDPAILERLGVHGMVPDIAMARRWYEAAQKFGSTEAGQRLAVLATTNR
jgi:hypothetical protein